jgi:hypothetical protein
MSYETRFLAALGFAVAVETPVLFLVLWHFLKVQNVGSLRVMYAGLMANVSSLPYLWFVLPALCRRYFVFAVAGEVGVVLWEALFYFMYFRLSVRHAMALSFAANLTSFLLGLFVF